MRTIAQRLEGDEGQTIVEYALILALIAIVAIVAVGALSDTIQNVFNSVSSTL